MAVIGSVFSINIFEENRDLYLIYIRIESTSIHLRQKVQLTQVIENIDVGPDLYK